MIEEYLKEVLGVFSRTRSRLPDESAAKHGENEVEELLSSNVINSLKSCEEKFKNKRTSTFLYNNGNTRVISRKLVNNYPESLLYVKMIDINSRINGKNIEIGNRFDYLDDIVKYMNNKLDICELNGVEFDAFCRELMEMKIPFRMDIMNRIYNGSNEYGVGWKNRCVIVNGNEYKMIFDYMKLKLRDIKNNKERERVEYSIEDKYEPIIQSYSTYLQDKSKGKELRSVIDRKLLNSFVDKYPLDMNNKDVQGFFNPIYSPFLKDTILFGQEYDAKLREWAGDYKWKLLYRTSEHGFTAESFHKYCDDKGPTLVVIKSSKGWIFGGYTTQSWKVVHPDEDGGIYYDMW